MKVLIIIGTRPEAIKMAVLINEFKKDNFFNIKLCTTEQHKEMLDQIYGIYGTDQVYIKPILKVGKYILGKG